MSGSALSFLKRGQVFKPRSRMELLFWLVLYPLRADPVRAEINLGCGTDLKVHPPLGPTQNHLVIKKKEKRKKE